MVQLMIRPAKLRALAPRLVRLSIFLAAVAVVLMIVLGRAVRAQAEGSLIELGAGLARLEEGTGASGNGSARVLELNGARLHFEVATRAEPVERVLDEVEAGCAPERDADRLRGGDGSRGFVACLSRRGPADTRVVGEVPLSARAGYRYVYAQPGLERTRVVTLWTDSAVDLPGLFPETGDAPGADAPGVPRPPASRRILSAREEGAPQQMTLYLTDERDPADLEAWYRARLPDLGWRPLDGKRARQDGPQDGPRTLVVDRSGTLAALVFANEETGGSSVSILTSL
jgi:hypothetical protein